MATLARRMGSIGTLADTRVRASVRRWQAADTRNMIANLGFGDIPWRYTRARDRANDPDVIGRSPTGYRPPQGELEVRQAVAADQARLGKPDIDPAENVCLTNGVIEGLHLTTSALLGQGDRAIIPAPHYFLYPKHVAITGASSTTMGTREADGYKLKPDQLRSELASGTVRVLFLNSPNNPTGAIYSRQELLAIASVLAEFRNVSVICDEVYERIYLEGQRHVSLWEAAPELRDRLVVLGSISKTTGLSEARAGWMVGPADVIRAAVELKAAFSWAVPMQSQLTMLAALSEPDKVDEHVTMVQEKLRASRDLMMERLIAMGLPAFKAPAGVFLLPHLPDGFKVPPLSIPNWDKMTLSERFAHFAVEHGLQFVPGVDLGAANHIRLSFALDPGLIDIGMQRLSEALAAAA